MYDILPENTYNMNEKKLDLTADEAVIWLQMTEVVSMRDEAELVLHGP